MTDLLTNCPFCNSTITDSRKIIVDVTSGFVILGELIVVLTKHQILIMEALVNARPRFISIPVILEHIFTLEVDWPQHKSIEVQICKIRRKIKGTGYRIQNRSNFGFALLRNYDE